MTYTLLTHTRTAKIETMIAIPHIISVETNTPAGEIKIYTNGGHLFKFTVEEPERTKNEIKYFIHKYYKEISSSG
ncbi:MAG: hypothetical protein AB1798_03020 [Spirochaetota bacterium]